MTSRYLIPCSPRGCVCCPSYECTCHGRYKLRLREEAQLMKITQERLELLVGDGTLQGRVGKGVYLRPYRFNLLLLSRGLVGTPKPRAIPRKDRRMLEHICGDRPQCGGGVLAALTFAPKL